LALDHSARDWAFEHSRWHDLSPSPARRPILDELEQLADFGTQLDANLRDHSVNGTHGFHETVASFQEGC
jgi:hypothetical protein